MLEGISYRQNYGCLWVQIYSVDVLGAPLRQASAIGMLPYAIEKSVYSDAFRNMAEAADGKKHNLSRQKKHASSGNSTGNA